MAKSMAFSSSHKDDGLKPICVIKGNIVELPPQLLKSRQPYVVRALVEDPGDGFYYEDHLVNVDIKRAAPMMRPRKRI